MFTKQVSRPMDSSDPPIVAAEAEQVERTRRETWSRARSERFCALQDPDEIYWLEITDRKERSPLQARRDFLETSKALAFEVAEDESLVLPEGVPEGHLLECPLPWSGCHATV
jgi:hypothetical protein